MRARAFWALPVLVTAVIVRYQAARPQLWRDEFATWWAATRPLPDLGRLTGHIDGVFVPYYLLMHGWLRVFGDSALALRAPSMLAVAATAGVVALLGAFLGSRWAGVLAGLLYAIVPTTSRYGQEARAYTLAALAAVAATLLLLLALRRQRWFLWAGYAVAMAAAGALHLVALLLLAGHLVVVADDVVRTRAWRTLLRAGGAAAAAGAAALPLVLRGQSQVGTQLGDRVPAPDLLRISELPVGVVGGPMLAGALVVLAAVGAFGTTRPAAVFGLLTIVPVVVFTVLGRFAPLFTPRYLLYVVPLACVLAGLALARLRPPGALVIVLLAGFGTLRDQDALRASHEGRGAAVIDYRGAARVVEAGRQPGDAIVYRRDGWQFADLATEYHLRDRTPDDVLAVTHRAAAGSYWTPETTDPATALAARDRVWVLVPDVLAPRRADTLPPATQAALERDHEQTRRWRVSGVTVWLYQRRPA